jgi:CHAT domain-containing protein
LQKSYDLALEVAERARVQHYRSLCRSAKEPPGNELNRLVPATISEIKQTANRLAATIIEYMPCEDNLLIWAVAPEGSITCDMQPIELARWESQLDKWRYDLASKSPRGEKLRAALDDNSAPAKPEAGAKAAKKAGNKASAKASDNTGDKAGAANDENIYKLFFPDAIANVLPTPAESRLIIIAPGRLATAPLAALQDDQGHYLIDRFILIGAPSISALVAQSRQQSADAQARVDNLIVGDISAALLNGKPLPLLEGGKDEVKTAAGAMKAKLLKGAMASIDALRDQSDNNHILHLDTYACLDDRQPLAGFIALSPAINDKGELISNGLLSMRELSGWHLTVDLFFLSAMQMQHHTNGDGLMAFENSLSLSGAGVAAFPLWSVETKTTAAFIKEFYNNLKKSNDLASGFHRAMLKTRAKFKQPTQWAAFVLIGAPAN